MKICELQVFIQTWPIFTSRKTNNLNFTMTLKVLITLKTFNSRPDFNSKMLSHIRPFSSYFCQFRLFSFSLIWAQTNIILWFAIISHLKCTMLKTFSQSTFTHSQSMSRRSRCALHILCSKKQFYSCFLFVQFYLVYLLDLVFSSILCLCLPPTHTHVDIILVLMRSK